MTHFSLSGLKRFLSTIILSLVSDAEEYIGKQRIRAVITITERRLCL
jgi:hypothetical protein